MEKFLSNPLFSIVTVTIEKVIIKKVMEVKDAEEATEIATSFIKRYRLIALPVKAVKEGEVWSVEIDVGPLAVKLAEVRIDAKTGSIISYEMPDFTPI